jgi:imidazolonepropionase-like amidohydrolase
MLEKLTLANPRVLVRNARVLDVERGELSDPTTVLCHNGMIRDVDCADPGGAVSLDLQGLTLTPGLIDCHVHILSPYMTEQKGVPGLWTFKQMDRNCIATVAAGVTCVCDMLSPIKILNRQKNKVLSGGVPGPEIIASGGIFSCEGGYPEAVHPVPAIAGALVGQPKYEPKTPREAARIAEYLYSQGARIIKVGYTRLSRMLVDGRTLPAIADDVLHGLCNAAHRLGVKVRVHHNWSEDMHHLLEFDIDCLEHGVYDRDLLDDEIQKVRDSGVTICPTLTINDSQARFEEKIGFLNSDRALEFFEPQALEKLKFVCETWTDFSAVDYSGSFGYTRANRYCYAAEERNTANLLAAGVPMVAGTDIGAVVAWPGELADELLRLESVGMSRIDAIRAATNRAAEFVDRPDLGLVKPGRTASFTVIEGNPLEDLRAFKKVRYTCVRGSWFKTKHPELPDFWPGHDVLFSLD